MTDTLREALEKCRTAIASLPQAALGEHIEQDPRDGSIAGGWAIRDELLSDIDAALSTDAQPAPSERSETAWLIELDDGGPKYWAGISEAPGDFTSNSLEAVRFARKQDAENVDAMLLVNIDAITRVVEHMWVAKREAFVERSVAKITGSQNPAPPDDALAKMVKRDIANPVIQRRFIAAITRERAKVDALLREAKMALGNTLYMAGEWYEHNGWGTTDADEYEAELKSARETLAKINKEQTGDE